MNRAGRINPILRRGPEIVIGMAAALALSLVCCLVYARGCGAGNGNAVFAKASDAAKASYRQDGPALLNDLSVTPGAVGPMTAAQICSKDFHTETVRSVSEATKHAVCAAYGIDRAHCVGLQPDGSGYEIDHLISLELAGSNDRTNLWPQAYNPKPAAKEKDAVENWLHAQVCAGKLDLATAQEQIRTDWYRVFLTMHPELKTGAGDAPGGKTQIRPDTGPGKVSGAVLAPGH